MRARPTLRVCPKAAVAPGAALRVRLAGVEPLAVCNLEGRFHVISDTCSHGLASLSEGEIEGGEIFCPFHGGSFDIATGEPRERPCVIPIKVYQVCEDDADVLILEPEIATSPP